MLKQKERMDLERQIIAGLGYYQSAFEEALSCDLTKDVFAEGKHSAIFEHMMEYYLKHDKPADSMELYSYLLSCEKDEEVRKYYMTSIMASNSMVSIVSLRQSIFMLKEDNMERSFRHIIKGLDQTGLTGWDMLEFVQDHITKLIVGAKNTSEVDAKQVLNDILTRVNNLRLHRETELEYYRTLFPNLDECMIGFHKKSFNIVAGRPAMGKTAFMLQLRRNLTRQGIETGVISMEMDADSLLIRDLADATALDSRKIETGNLSEEEFRRLVKARETLLSQPFAINDTGSQTVERIIATIINWRIKRRIKAIIVDYLTLINSTKDDLQKGRNDLIVGGITQRFREFAKETGIPIIMLAQLNRGVESRPDKKPSLADLRESGNIEQDARSIIFLYRPAYYGLDPFKGNPYNFKTLEGQELKPQEYAELLLAKSRNGRTGTIPVRYQPELHRFSDLNSYNKGFELKNRATQESFDFTASNSGIYNTETIN